MSKLEQMKNLRGGVIYGAARVAPTTARTWSIELGTTRGLGHPRYDVTDAVMLITMRQLTGEASIAAGPAAMIVNAIRPYLPNMIEKVVQEQESTGKWRWEGGPFAIVTGKPTSAQGVDPSTWIAFCFADDPGVGLADRRSGLSPIVLPLRRLINRAILSLDQVLHGELSEYSEA